MSRSPCSCAPEDQSRVLPARTSKEDPDDAMEGGEEAATPKPGREKAGATLKALKEMDADEDVIQAAQKKLDSLPPVQEQKQPQEHWEAAKVSRIRAQLQDARVKEKKQEQDTFAKFQTQIQELQAKLENHKETMQNL